MGPWCVSLSLPPCPPLSVPFHLESANTNTPPPQQDDPLAPARASERALLSSLTTLAAPSSPLVFTRLTTSPTSSDLFGSVSTADVVSALRDRGVVAAANAGDAASGSGSPIQGAFREGQDGVLNGRVKRVGEFVFEVELKTLGDKVPVVVQVAREDNKAGSA